MLTVELSLKTIAYCVKRIDGVTVGQGTVSGERKALTRWLSPVLGRPVTRMRPVRQILAVVPE